MCVAKKLCRGFERGKCWTNWSVKWYQAWPHTMLESEVILDFQGAFSAQTYFCFARQLHCLQHKIPNQSKEILPQCLCVCWWVWRREREGREGGFHCYSPPYSHHLPLLRGPQAAAGLSAHSWPAPNCGLITRSPLATQIQSNYTLDQKLPWVRFELTS